MTFRPVVSGQVLFITALVMLILLALGVLFFFLQHQARNQGASHYMFLSLGCVMFLLVIGCLNFRIHSYEVSGTNLIVHAGFGKKVFSLSGLQDCRLEENPFSDAHKEAASSGVWSFYGKFNSARWGEFHAYATTTARGVLLVWPDKKVLVTPADAEAFIQAAKSVK